MVLVETYIFEKYHMSTYLLLKMIYLQVLCPHRYMDRADRPDTAAAALKKCDPDYFPNISTLLRLICTLPVTSCECERGNSTLKRLNTHLRASMTQKRLSNLCLIQINYDREFDLDEIVNIYSKLHTRRLELDSLL